MSWEDGLGEGTRKGARPSQAICAGHGQGLWRFPPDVFRFRISAAGVRTQIGRPPPPRKGDKILHQISQLEQSLIFSPFQTHYTSPSLLTTAACNLHHPAVVFYFFPLMHCQSLMSQSGIKTPPMSPPPTAHCNVQRDPPLRVTASTVGRHSSPVSTRKFLPVSSHDGLPGR